MRNGDVSFWFAEAGGPPARRPALAGDLRADVCIVGAGFTGLWTAYYLKRARPSLNVVVLESEFAGFGASGRNGGWLTGSFGWPSAPFEAAAGREAVRAMRRALLGSVDEVISVARVEGIDADIRPADELIVATNPAQMQRLRADLAERLSWQVAEDRVRLIGAQEARDRVAIPALHGAMVIEGQARIQPARLVCGLARLVERQGTVIAEGTRVTGIRPGAALTALGAVHAPVVLRATEGFTVGFAGHRRDLLPLNSAQIVTAPLPDAIWDRIGWQGFEILGDAAHSYCYAQRTRDGRIAMGGRGLPYRYGSRFAVDGNVDAVTARLLRERLLRHFPMLAGVPVDHAWSGVLGVARDWAPAIAYDRATGLGAAGGYVGTGVATSNLAGRTLADLVLDRASDLVAMPWINRRTPRWEPEPLRWLGVRAVYALYAAADRSEDRRGLDRTAIAGRLGHLLAG